MIAISIANSVGSRRSSAPVVVVPVATAATGVGETSFTANWNAFAGANYYLLDVSLNSSFSSFVGSYQNYVTIGTSQLVSGLTPNTTYYYRLRAVTGVDSDAAAFFSRVYTAGGVLSYTEVTATETLVYDMKTAGVWSAMKAVYPMIGASAAACAQNLKSSSFTGTFTSGWTFASTGVTPNGTSAYMSTGFVPSANLTETSQSSSIYSRTNTSGASVTVDLSSVSGVGNFSLSADLNTVGIHGFVRYGQTTDVRNTSTQRYDGYFVGSRTANNVLKLWRSNVQLVGTQTATDSGISTVAPTLGAENNNGTISNYSNKEYAFASMGDGLTDTQASNFYTAVQTFNQTLSRSVGPQIVSDADAQAYINRVYTAGGTLTNTEANAVNQLVIDMKGAGIWTAMKAVYPMVGASAAACAQNLKSSSFTGTFTSGWTFASNGVTGNGTSSYMNPGGFNSAANLSLNSAHISYYSRTNSASSMVMAGTQSLYVLGRWTNYHANNSVESDLGGISTGSTTAGFFMSNRTIGTEMKYQINGSIQTDSTSTAATASTTESTPLYMGCQNTASFGIRLFNNYSTAFYSIGDGLTDTQAANLYTAVQIFNTTLGRQVAG